MTSTPSHQAGNSRRDQLTAALVVGAVVVTLGAASGLGIEFASGASLLAKPPVASTHTQQSGAPSSAARIPVNYIGTPGPGNIAVPLPGIVIDTSGPSTTPGPSPSTSATTPPTQPPTTATSTTASNPWPTLSCPSDVVTGLLDVILGNKGLLGSSLLRTILNLIPELPGLLKIAGLSSVLTTDVGALSSTQRTSMAQACTPVMSGLLGRS